MQTLSNWLIKLKKSEIKLGLDRVDGVYKKLIPKLNSTVITVAGTNGKGSTCAFLEAIYSQAGFKVGKLTSPELFCYNEQIQINNKQATDTQIIKAFEVITQTKGDIELSYFEYLTLASLWLFWQNKVDIIILEVGLGGRLDAVNIVDCDCAVLTNIGLDHCDFLGSTKEQIALEKVGVARKNTPLICSELNPPQSLIDYIARHHIPTTFIKQGYQGEISLLGKHQKMNAQLALSVVESLQSKHPISQQICQHAIASTQLMGRLQHQPYGDKLLILDVAHNEDSAQALAQHLHTLKLPVNQTTVIFSTLKDKNIEAIIDKIAPLVDSWHLCPLQDVRFCYNDLLQRTQSQLSILGLHSPIVAHDTLLNALKNINSSIKFIIICGSFQMVANALKVVKIQ